LAKQRNDITIIVPPCPQGQPKSGGQPSGGVGTAQSTANAPAGSSRIVAPKGTLTQTVAVQPCQPPQSQQSGSGSSSGGGGSSQSGGGGSSQSSGGGSSGGSSQAVSTILMTPGGTAPQS